MTALDDVKRWMTFFGWTDGGGRGAVKQDADKAVIARHGDATWIADVEEACAKSERQRIIAELEERDRLAGRRDITDVRPKEG